MWKFLRDFNTNLGREEVSKLTIGNESVHEHSKDKGVRGGNSATSKSSVVTNIMDLHRNIHNTHANLPIRRLKIRLITDNRR